MRLLKLEIYMIELLLNFVLFFVRSVSLWRQSRSPSIRAPLRATNLTLFFFNFLPIRALTIIELRVHLFFHHPKRLYRSIFKHFLPNSILLLDDLNLRILFGLFVFNPLEFRIIIILDFWQQFCFVLDFCYQLFPVGICYLC